MKFFLIVLCLCVPFGDCSPLAASADSIVAQATSWMVFWSRFSDEAWGEWCDGQLGYTAEEWTRYFSTLSAWDWMMWQIEYLVSRAKYHLLKHIRSRVRSRL